MSVINLVPDREVVALADGLVTLVETAPLDPAQEALVALAALGRRLPSPAARRMLAMLRPYIGERAEDQAGSGDREALDALRTAGHHADADIAAAAADLLVDALRARVYAAEDYLGDLPPTRVQDVERLAENGNPAAITVLARWEQRSPAVTAAARAGAQRILDHPLGERESFTTGGSAPQDALALRCALTNTEPGRPPSTDETAGESPPLDGLRDQVVDHLAAWAEDRYDIAGSRVSALASLRILRDRTPDDQQQHLHTRLLAVADNPNLYPGDLVEQASTHPMSYVSFNTGSEHLAADALLTAATFTVTPDHATAVADRLAPALAIGDTDPQDAELRARTLQKLERLHPLPLQGLAHHPAPAIRTVVARLWARRNGEPSGLAAVLAAAPEARVRRAIAGALRRLPDSQQATHAELLGILADDPSASVRAATRAAARHP